MLSLRKIHWVPEKSREKRKRLKLKDEKKEQITIWTHSRGKQWEKYQLPQ